MKVKTILFISLICMQVTLCAVPLTIINSTKEITTFNVTLKSGTQKVILEPGTKWTSTLNNDLFLSVTWDRYNVNIQQQAPAMMHGGAFVVGNDGHFMYDYKQGKGIQFGQAG